MDLEVGWDGLADKWTEVIEKVHDDDFLAFIEGYSNETRMVGDGWYGSSGGSGSDPVDEIAIVSDREIARIRLVLELVLVAHLIVFRDLTAAIASIRNAARWWSYRMVDLRAVVNVAVKW